MAKKLAILTVLIVCRPKICDVQACTYLISLFMNREQQVRRLYKYEFPRSAVTIADSYHPTILRGVHLSKWKHVLKGNCPKFPCPWMFFFKGAFA